MFSRTVHAHRSRLNMDVKTLAESVGITHSEICQIELGNRLPTNSLIRKICKTLNTSPTIHMARRAKATRYLKLSKDVSALTVDEIVKIIKIMDGGNDATA